jgi:uncharacterized membrane protein YgcG
MNRFTAAIFLFLLITRTAAALPDSQEYYTDKTGALENLETEIEQLCTRLEQETSCEFAVLIVDSLEGKTIENYSYDVFNTWEIGKEEQDNGILFILAIDDRKARLEVGYGLEYLFSETKINNFLMEYAAPYFKEDDWETGIREIVHAIAVYISDEYDPLYSSGQMENKIAGDKPEKYSWIETAGKYFWDSFIQFYILITFLFINVIIIITGKFITARLFSIEIFVCILINIFAAVTSSYGDFGSSFIFTAVCLIIYFIQFTRSERHKCPKCGGYLDITSVTETYATYSQSGTKRVDLKCRNCEYRNSEYYTIPQKVRYESSKRSSSGYSSMKRYSSGSGYRSSSSPSYSSGRRSSFGGGSSGGRGSSISF